MVDESEPTDDSLLPISWDEGRELLVVALLGASLMYVLAPTLGVINARSPAGRSDDLAAITRNVEPTLGLMLIAAGVLIATTPSVDVVAGLRQAVVIVAGVVVALGVVAITVELTRPSAVGVLLRLQTVLGRSGPGAVLAATAGWLARRVVPFPS